MTYDFNHGAQRITAKRMAELVSLPTTKRGPKRSVPIPLTVLRIMILERCLGRDIGTVAKHCRNMAQTDAWLAASVVAVYLGKLGILHQLAQTALRNANNAYAELKELQVRHAASKAQGRNGRNLLTQIEAKRPEVRSLYDIARGYIDAIEADNALRGNGVALTAVHAADREAVAQRVKLEAAMRRAAKERFFQPINNQESYCADNL